MSETRLHSVLRRIIVDLSEVGASCAVIGGLAVSARTEPRFTKDVDLAVAVTQDGDAELLVQQLSVALRRKDLQDRTRQAFASALEGH